MLEQVRQFILYSQLSVGNIMFGTCVWIRLCIFNSFSLGNDLCSI